MKPLPQNLMQDCLESYIYKHTTKSQAIYITVLLAVIASLISLPLIYVDVTVQNAGMVRPVNERTEVKASVSEWVDSVYVREGTRLQQGDTILRLRTDNLSSRRMVLQQKIGDLNRQLSDLGHLARGNEPQHFASGVRMQEYTYYIKRKNELETLLEKARNEFGRNKQLFDKEVISPNEYEQYMFALRKAENEYSSLANNRMCILPCGFPCLINL